MKKITLLIACISFVYTMYGSQKKLDEEQKNILVSLLTVMEDSAKKGEQLSLTELKFFIYQHENSNSKAAVRQQQLSTGNRQEKNHYTSQDAQADNKSSKEYKK